MDTPILKSHWERFKAHIDLDVSTAIHLLAPYTNDMIDKLVLLSEGCANTNYKVSFKNNRSPVVIRIYMREKSALAREIAIHKLVADKIPVPAHFYSNDQCTNFSYPYSVMEWVDGILMREIILKKNKSAIIACAFEMGNYLDIMRQIKFSEGGFFQKELTIQPFNQEEQYLPYVLNLLQDRTIKESLGDNLLSAVSYLVNDNATLLPDSNNANLTHADYDPANILVTQINNKWKIAAILDWEFAFAGTYLLDIGMALRYSHKIPDSYENSFIAGIRANGFQLPVKWKKQAKLMDLLCLLQLSHYNPISERPKLNRDVVSLIADTVDNWDLF
ncbi:MAG: aminoglycoside phosphotransferase family protein [Gammaproteobacteria bacterium]|nr:aminoglycoside phosphotransferase family protein [Gammaproteobacteria bacterium]